MSKQMIPKDSHEIKFLQSGKNKHQDSDTTTYLYQDKWDDNQRNLVILSTITNT